MLAELADVSPQYISLLENGKRGKKVSFSVMCRLSTGSRSISWTHFGRIIVLILNY